MKLPNADKSIVEREKILDYLLNSAHRHGASKAQFFKMFGFRAEKWEQLAQALRIHGKTHEVKRTRETGFGPRYEVEGISFAASHATNPKRLATSGPTWFGSISIC